MTVFSSLLSEGFVKRDLFMITADSSTDLATVTPVRFSEIANKDTSKWDTCSIQDQGIDMLVQEMYSTLVKTMVQRRRGLSCEESDNDKSCK